MSANVCQFCGRKDFATKADVKAHEASSHIESKKPKAKK